MNKNLEALMVEQILTSAKQAATYACMSRHARNVAELFLDADLLQDILEKSGVYGVSGGIWYDYSVRRVIKMLDHLDFVSTTEGTGSSEAFTAAAELSELTEKLQARYNFN